MMTTATFTTQIPTVGTNAGGLLRRTIRVFGEWMATNKARAELHQMSDHDLKDIGLTRGVIDEVVRKAPYSY